MAPPISETVNLYILPAQKTRLQIVKAIDRKYSKDNKISNIFLNLRPCRTKSSNIGMFPFSGSILKLTIYP